MSTAEITNRHHLFIVKEETVFKVTVCRLVDGAYHIISCNETVYNNLERTLRKLAKEFDFAAVNIALTATIIAAPESWRRC